MKTMTCRQLGGACDLAFHGSSFEEMEAQIKSHGMEMFKNGDKAHLAAMQKMKNLMTTPDAMKEWFDDKRKEFEALPED
jgi:predicted small metal-binding protein